MSTTVSSRQVRWLFALIFALAASGLAFTLHAAAPGAVIITISKSGTTSFASAPPAGDSTNQPAELDDAFSGDADAGGGAGDNDEGGGVGRTIVGAKTGHGRAIGPHRRAKSNPALGTHFQGLNFHDQRFANGGNQFSVEPPDQALCAGNGFLVESVNDVLQVYDTAGTALLNGGHAVDLNTFYGYAAAINRTTNARGPSITDPVCFFDAPTQRFFHVVLTLDHVGTTASLSGKNHLDIAVSDTSNPTGTWTIYKLPVQNNGTDGTPNHHCGSGFCLGDYPHIGADANGIYLTTNEFAFSGPGFYGAQIYAIPKTALVTGASTLPVVLINTLNQGPDGAGFTVWPAVSPGTTTDAANGGREHFLSSRAVFADDGESESILLWSLSNTSSLDASPALDLAITTIGVDVYGVPPLATQKAGSQPLSECIADLVFPCNTTIAGIASHNNAQFAGLNSNDSRFGQVSYANGKVWGALGTAVTVGGHTRAGIGYYIVNPSSGKLVLQGQAGFADTDLTYPEVGVLENGRGVMSFTLTGDNDYPTAAYASLDAKTGFGEVQIAAAGVGRQDGFTQYRAFATRPRWGDYGATATDGNAIWVASEYVAQSCTYAQYLVAPAGQCGGTRAPLGNWSTHISRIQP